MKFIITVDNLRSVNGYTIAPRQLAIGLRARGHKVLLVCWKAPLTFYPGENKQDFAEISISPILNDNIFKKFSPDVIIGNSYVPSDLIGLDYAKKHKIFIIYFVHSRIEKLLQQRMPLGEYWPDYVYKAIVDVLVNRVKHADVVIALNKEMYSYLLEKFNTTSLEIISNGIDLEQFAYKKRRINPKGQVNLLYVANFESRKNQIFLLKVMSSLPSNITLHLVGCKEDPIYFKKFNTAFKKYQRESLNHGKVINHGKVDHLKITELYNQADIFVDSSIMEAQSLVLIEAIASGLPIIRLFEEDTAGVTEDGKTAIHIDKNLGSKEFGKVILNLINDPVLYEKMGNEQKRIRKKFSREASVDRLLEVIAKYKH